MYTCLFFVCGQEPLLGQYAAEGRANQTGKAVEQLRLQPPFK